MEARSRRSAAVQHNNNEFIEEDGLAGPNGPSDSNLLSPPHAVTSGADSLLVLPLDHSDSEAYSDRLPTKRKMSDFNLPAEANGASASSSDSKDHGGEKEVSLTFLYFMITCYAFSYHMSFPIFPYMVAKFRGGDARDGQLAFGAFRSFNQTLQLIGSLLAGSLVDRIGCKNVILLSFAASVACYVLLALATNLTTLYLSQLPALLQHVLLASRGFVSFAVPSERRSIAFGRLATSYGIGAVIGPAVGGVLGKWSFSLPAVVSAVTCLLAGLAVLEFLPDIHSKANKEKAEQLKRDLLPPPTPIRAYLDLLKNPRLSSILLLKLFFLLAVSLHSATVQMVSGPRFGMDTAAAGALMSASAVMATVSQGLLVRPILAVLAPAEVTILAAFVLAPSYISLGYLSKPWHLYVLTAPITIVSTLQNLVSAQEAVDAAPASGRGSYIGLEQALASGGRMIAPAAAAWIVGRGGVEGCGYTAAALVITGVVVWRFNRRRNGKAV